VAVGTDANKANDWKSSMRRILLETGKRLLRRSEREGAELLDGEAWEKYQKAVRRRDAVRVGSQVCAASPEGCAVATRGAQFQVLIAALDLLDEGGFGEDAEEEDIEDDEEHVEEDEGISNKVG